MTPTDCIINFLSYRFIIPLVVPEFPHVTECIINFHNHLIKRIMSKQYKGMSLIIN